MYGNGHSALCPPKGANRMKYRNRLRIAQIRKHNAFLNNCADSCHSPLLKMLILAGRINGAKIGQTVLKGTK